MKRLVYLLLVFCMLVPCMAHAELLEDSMIVDAAEDVFVATPEEIIQEPVDASVVLPEFDELLMVPSDGVDGPKPYRELVLLKPTNLQGEAINENTIRLAWGPVAFATSYDVYRKVLGEADYTLIASTPGEQLYYEDAVTPGTVVYYRVQALNVSYEGDTPVVTYSPQTNTLPFITLEKPVLSDPRGLDADTLRLNWQTVSGANSYEVEIATEEAGPYAVARKDLTGALCNVDGLTPEQGYYFRMRAVRTFSSGEKFYSNYSEPIKCGTPMDRPVLTVAAEGSSAVLSWTPSSGATGYVIYRKVGAEGSYTKLTIVEDVTGYVDTGLTAGEVYYYFVYAIRPVGSYNCFSLSSDTRYFAVVEAAVLCSVQNTGDQEQTIDWTGPNGASTCKGASKYLVYSSTTLDGMYTMIGETTDTKYVVTGLTPGQTYYYKVRAVRTFSNGDVSYGPWSNVLYMPEAGELQINGYSAVNTTLNKDIAGGYVGDVFTWSTVVSGGSGEYTFKYSLVGLNGGTPLVLKNFTDAYTSLPEGEGSLKHTFSVVLTDEMCDLITNQKYAMEIEVRDSEGASVKQIACEDTWNEMNFCAPKPSTQMINITLRVGEKLELAHGICPEAGDTILMDVSNPTGAVSIADGVVTAVSNGYATILVTPERYKNDILVAYHITVGYATLAINSITANATTLNAYDTLSWDISYTGGRPEYTLNIKVYRDNTLVINKSETATTTGLLSVNYQPTVAGDYMLEAIITSADGQSVTKRSAVTKVVEYTPVTVSPDVTSASTGDTITWTMAYTGVNSVVRCDYVLYLDGAVAASSVGTNAATFSYTPTTAGKYVLQVVVYESNGNKIETTSATVSVALGAPAGSVPATVTGVRVALRKGPGTSYGIYMRIDKGETINVVKMDNSKWYYVEYKGTYGWMMSEYIKLK